MLINSSAELQKERSGSVRESVPAEPRMAALNPQSPAAYCRDVVIDDERMRCRARGFVVPAPM
jgi:hypothetical protein